MKKTLSIFTYMLILPICFSTILNYVRITAVTTSSVENTATNEIIVTYQTNIDNDNVIHNPLIASSKLEEETAISDNSVLLKVKDTDDITDISQTLKQDSSVRSIQPNYSYQITGTVSDPYFSKQWGLYNDGSFVDEFDTSSISSIDLDIEKAWDTYENSSNKKEVIVAVIDTGIDYTHDDLKDVIWTNTKEIANDGIDNDKNGYIDDIYGWNFYSDTNVVYNSRTNEDEHGTHCAGIIAAKQNNIGIAGVASNVTIKLMSLKALGGRDGLGSTDSMIEAISYAKKMGASICNISAGTYNDDLALELAMKDSGMLFVVSAGNGDSNGNGLDNDSTPIYPASFDLDTIISVANLSCDGNLHSSSNYGKQSVDIAAPGTSIYSTIPHNKYCYLTGTSMAAPMVTGLSAMVFSYYPNITLSQTKDVILDSVRKLSQLSGKVLTGGIPDAYSALSYNQNALLALDTTPPVIKTSEQKQVNSYYKSLSISVKDMENQIEQARYSKGIRTLSYFNGGYGQSLKLSNGNAKITVTDSSSYTIYAVDTAGNKSLKTVKVTITKPTKITVVSNKTVRIGKTYTLVPILSPSNVVTGLAFTSSDKTVATITSTSGKITTKKKGFTIITVKTQNGLLAKCKVTVTN